MKPKQLLICLAVCYCAYANAQKVIVVQHNGTPSFYSLFQDAVAGANSGDTIYLPGMESQINNNIVIDKELHIIGAGWSSDSSAATGRTHLTGSGYLYIVSGASGTSFEGFRCDFTILVGNNINNQDVDNLRFSRMYLGYLTLGYTDNINADSCLIDECIITHLTGMQMKHVMVTNSLIGTCVSDYPMQIMMGSTFRNCIFILQDGPYFSDGNSNCTYENCVIQTQYGGSIQETSASNNSFEFCLSNQTLGVPLKTNCYESVSNIFQSYTCSNAFEDNDFHLLDPSTYLGNDGTQVGIYGTALPFKQSGCPTNPHIAYKSIAPGTDANGNLQINIKVVAQDH